MADIVRYNFTPEGMAPAHNGEYITAATYERELDMWLTANDRLREDRAAARADGVTRGINLALDHLTTVHCPDPHRPNGFCLYCGLPYPCQPVEALTSLRDLHIARSENPKP